MTTAEERNEQEMRLPWRMRVIGRIAGLEMLDGPSITKDERILCEKRYMSVEVAIVWLKDEKTPCVSTHEGTNSADCMAREIQKEKREKSAMKW